MDIPQHTAEPQLLIGSTHMQIRNDENLKESLEHIFDGGVGRFFETEAK